MLGLNRNDGSMLHRWVKMMGGGGIQQHNRISTVIQPSVARAESVIDSLEWDVLISSSSKEVSLVCIPGPSSARGNEPGFRSSSATKTRFHVSSEVSRNKETNRLLPTSKIEANDAWILYGTTSNVLVCVCAAGSSNLVNLSHLIGFDAPVFTAQRS